MSENEAGGVTAVEEEVNPLLGDDVDMVDVVFGSPKAEDAEEEEEDVEAGDGGGENPEEGAGEDGEEDSEEQPAAEMPETIRVGDTDVPFADAVAELTVVQEAKAELAEMFKGIESGVDLRIAARMAVEFNNLLADVDESMYGANRAIHLLVGHAIEKHGAKAEGLRDIDLRELDPANLTGEALLLYGAVQAAKAETAQVSKRAMEALQEAKKWEAKLAEMEAGPKLVAKVKEKYPGAEVDAAALRSLMTKHGVNDPVKAFILENHDSLSKPDGSSKKKQGTAGAEHRSPNLPKTGGTKTFDPTGMGLRQIQELTDKGMKPRFGNKVSA